MITLEKKKEVIDAILEDEKEYCFDKSYVSDETWAELGRSMTREEAYQNSKNFCESLLALSDNEFIKTVQTIYDDKYDYLL